MLEGAPREFARLGRPQPIARRQRLEHRSHDGAAAVNVQLDNVLACEAARRGERQDHALIEIDAGPGMAQFAQPGFARRRRLADHDRAAVPPSRSVPTAG